jgi:hypothetical protein
MLGRIPSHVSQAASAASASVVPTGGYFGTQKRKAIEINARRVICPKHACVAHGSRDYACHQEAATKALPRGGTHKNVKNIFLTFLIFELGDLKIYMSIR